MDAESTVPLDLDAYFDRIAYAGPRTPTLETLRAIHFGHATHIPFENLDVILGRPIRMDLASVQAKLVHGRRGGYCFEQNNLLGAVLDRLGFQVTLLSARVRWNSTRIIPRTHLLLLVEIEGIPWLADVGFGSWGLLEPMPLVENQIARQFDWAYRLVKEGREWVVQTLKADLWLDLYTFTMEPQILVDFETANHYVSTHPNSRFVRTVTAQWATPTSRLVLRGRTLTQSWVDREEVQTLEDDEAVLRVLAERFTLVLPPGTRFPNPEPQSRT